MSVDDTPAAVDAGAGCQLCGGPLGDSPSDDFCCEDHQRWWYTPGGRALGQALRKVFTPRALDGMQGGTDRGVRR